MLSSLARLKNSSLSKRLQNYCMDFHGDHTSTCIKMQAQSTVQLKAMRKGETKAHDWMVGVLGPLFRTLDTRSAPSSVTASAGQRRGDVVFRNYLRDQAGSRSLVFNLSVTHERFGSSRYPQQNELLTQDLDAPWRLAAQRKIKTCGQQ